MKKHLSEMKKIYWMLAVCCVIFGSVMMGLSVCAETSGDYTYTVLDDGTVEITGYSFSGSATELKIPETIEEQTVTRIGSHAFYWHVSLTKIVIPESVESIGFNAFTGCIRLTELTIPESVESIDSYAFHGCSGLTEITIPESVTSIGMGVFSDCSGLTAITVAEGNEAYDSRNGCNAIIKTETNELIAGCQNTVIPDTVATIADSAFSECSSLTELTIPESVTSIGFNAFTGCSGLTELTIPESVESIRDYAFTGCSGLTVITVAEGNEVYDSRNECNAIIETETNKLIAGCQNTVIPDTVTSIGFNAFSECSGLTEITIPESVESIGESAFYGCSGLTKITISKGVESIGGLAFYRCSSLTEIIIPESVENIGGTAFCGCSDLTEITIPESVTSIGDYAFNGCSGLTEITIPESVTSIGDYAFMGCSEDLVIMTEEGSAAAEYAAENNIRHVPPCDHTGGTATCAEKAVCEMCGFHYGKKAPENHVGDTEIRDAVEATETEEGYTGDTYCSSCGELLESGELIPMLTPKEPEEPEEPTEEPGTTEATDPTEQPGTTEATDPTEQPGTTESTDPAEQPGTTEAVDPTERPGTTESKDPAKPGETTQTDNPSQTPDNQGQTEEVVGVAGTDGQPAEKTVIVYVPTKAPQLGESFEVYGLNYKITSIDKRTVSCLGLGSAASGNIQLVIPQRIQIDNAAYTISKIEKGAFANQKQISSVIVGDGVSEIGESAFENAEGIGALTFGAGVQSVGAKAFQNCKGLKNVTINSGKFKCVGKAAFKNTGKYTMSASKSSLAAYQKLINSSAKAKSLLVSNLFYQVVNEKKKTARCTGTAKKLSKVSVPSTVSADGTKYKVTEIGSSAFKNDKKVTKMTLQSTNLTTIGSSAFQNCKKLKQLTIKSTKLKKVGKNAFKGCQMDVTVPPQKTDQYTKLFKGKW